MSKKSYEGIKAGDVLIVDYADKHDGVLVEKGTEFTVSCFPPKVRKGDRDDKNKKGYVRDYFVCGTTINEVQYKFHGEQKSERITVRLNLNQIKKKRKG